ncbi:MAG TPA: response regulator, partial [Polyangiaceae bacterium]|nr:response regulator [Polyangiaceae bacterium]
MATILIIEDNPANMKLAVFLLQRAGYTVLSATDAESGLALAREHRQTDALPRSAVHGRGPVGAHMTALSKPRAEQPRILIVDDEPDNRELLQVVLDWDGFVTETAASGEEALARAAEHPPDLMLLDLMMPGLDGCQVTALLKQNLATKDIPGHDPQRHERPRPGCACAARARQNSSVSPSTAPTCVSECEPRWAPRLCPHRRCSNAARRLEASDCGLARCASCAMRRVRYATIVDERGWSDHAFSMARSRWRYSLSDARNTVCVKAASG